MRKMTKQQKEEYDRLTKDAEQLKLDMEALTRVTYGYARVSTKGQARDGNSLESQKAALRAAGATEIFVDAFTGTTTDRPELDRLLSEVQSGDTIVVTKLDRIARSVSQGINLIDSLLEKGVRVHVLNIGLLDSLSASGRLIRNIFLAFAEFEREMIMQRTREGKEIARKKSGYHEGRPPKFSPEQRAHAVSLLEEGYSYRQIYRMTGVSVSTLVRIKRAESGS